MTTDKQTDYFKQYKNVEQVTGSGVLGYSRFIGQLKDNKWAVWETSNKWGGGTFKPRRLRDLSGDLMSFETREQAISYAERIK